MDRVVELRPEFVEGLIVTLRLAAAGLFVGGAIGLVIGAALYVSRTRGIVPSRPVSLVLNVLVNFMRPIPFVLILIVLQPVSRWFGISEGHALVTVVFGSAFGIARIVEQNLVAVDPGVLEAARAMGASRWRVVWSVLLPEARGSLILGFTYALVAIVDMTTLVGIIGVHSLGYVALTYGLRQFDWTVTAVAILVIIAIVQIGQFAGNAWARRVLRR
jgi:D-methionine transport system permease protein